MTIGGYIKETAIQSVKDYFMPFTWVWKGICWLAKYGSHPKG